MQEKKSQIEAFKEEILSQKKLNQEEIQKSDEIVEKIDVASKKLSEEQELNKEEDLKNSRLKEKITYLCGQIF